MLPLPSVEIPVIVRSDDKGKAQLGGAPKPRIYSDEPLPIAPSSYAPKNAKITGRGTDNSGAFYTLKIGEVEINDVSVEEILEYVSPLELEDFENGQFVEEGIAQEAAEAAEEGAKQEKLERMKHRAKTKGVVFYESDTASNDDTEDREQAVGRHGRARPTYTHLFKRFKDKKGRTLAPAADPLDIESDHEEEVSEDEPVAPIVRGSESISEFPKRRRRKRDKATGELLPLSPVAQKPGSDKQKGRRRRRHPLTGELMPVGWKFDPNNQNGTYEKRHSGQSPDRKLSISQGHKAKRPRLDTGSEWSRSPSPLPSNPSGSSPSKLRPFGAGDRHRAEPSTMVLVSSENDEEEVPTKQGTASITSPPKSTLRSTSYQMKSMALSSAAETSPEPPLRPFVPTRSPNKMNPTSSQTTKTMTAPSLPTVPKTSITSPSAGRASSTEPPVMASEEEESDEEWFIEDVLNHSLSDPRTHPAALGNKPVMLYQVKWEGSQDPTWEPAESFTDRGVLDDYHKQNGLHHKPSDEMEDGEDEDMTAVVPKRPEPPRSEESADNEEDLDEDEYEVEAILGHQSSDPRTHPPELGKKPVMLYRVKWKGYDELTWEPASSFEDTAMVQSYNEHYGLDEATAHSDGGDEMDESM